jgi:hypothetical protein
MDISYFPQKVLEERDAEIEELQARLSKVAAQAPNIQIDTERSHVALLTQVRLQLLQCAELFVSSVFSEHGVGCLLQFYITLCSWNCVMYWRCS